MLKELSSVSFKYPPPRIVIIVKASTTSTTVGEKGVIIWACKYTLGREEEEAHDDEVCDVCLCQFNVKFAKKIDKYDDVDFHVKLFPLYVR